MSSVMIFQLNRKGKKVTWKKPVWSRRSPGIKLAFHPGVQIPDVLLNTLFCFLIGPWGVTPPTPQRPICSLGSQSHQPVPELWASWASCLQVCAETSGGGGTGAQCQSRCCDWRRVMKWKQISGQRSQSKTDPKTTRQEAAETKWRKLWFLVRSSS